VGIAKNVAVVTRIGEQVGGIKDQHTGRALIAGVVGAALFAFDRAKKKAHQHQHEPITG
jgi:hypothetical protein